MGKTTAERYSPPWIIEGAREVMGGIDLDPASSEFANQSVLARHHFTRNTDGLTQQWWGRVFLNPPFGMSWKSWIIKLNQEVEAGRVQQAVVIGQGNVLWALLHPWFHILLRGSFLFPQEPIKFYDPGTRKWLGVRYGVFLCYIGGNFYRFSRVFGDKGRILRPVFVPNSHSVWLTKQIKQGDTQ